MNHNQKPRVIFADYQTYHPISSYPNSAPSPSKTVPTSSLSTELHLVIISHLDLPDAQLPRQTCRHFAALIPALDSLDALLAAEQSASAREANIFACAVCLRLCCEARFSDEFRKGCKWERDGSQREKRFCIGCGMRSSGGDPRLKYKRGEGWTKGGLLYVRCRVCWFKKRQVKERKGCKICEGCWNSGRR